MQLSELKTGAEGIVIKVRGRGAFRRRIMEMGFIRGKNVKVIKNAPLKDPVEYSLMDYRVSLRRSEAELIEVVPAGEWSEKPAGKRRSKETVKEIRRSVDRNNIINVAFVGNPNAGKTSVFNFSSRSHEHTGNYPGVTVDSKSVRISFNGYVFNITDLPGTYSLSAYSPEELVVREYITGEIPDVIVNVVDASNLERNFYLTTQLIDMDVKVVLALNMFDELERRDDYLDYSMLGKLLGIPMVPTVGSKGKGIRELFERIIDVYNDTETLHRHIHINYGEELEKSIERVQKYIKIPGNYMITDRVSSRFISIKLLERDSHIKSYLSSAPNFKEIMENVHRERNRIENLYGEDIVSIFTGERYGFINGALMETYRKNKNKQVETTQILDSFLTHKVFGFPFFIFFMWVIFASTFKFGHYPQKWIDFGVTRLGIVLSENMADGSFKDMLTEGIIGGVGGVLVFLPNILILFLFISFMEDTGYMARAVFIMDKLMHKIGLHGKSFIPLIMGFGCNVPAIMATRVIEDKNNRLLTILINPFMSCSARLPVYLLLIGAVFPAFQGTFLFLLYFLGILLAILMALVFKKTLFRSEGTPFVMELPPYRMPTLRSTLKHMWAKGSQYLKKMSGVILIASILLWALSYFPRNGLFDENTATPVHNNPREAGTTELSAEAMKNARLEYSYIGRIGKFIEPAIRPLGFDWKMGVSLISGIAAKEIVVSTLGILYQTSNEASEDKNILTDKIRSQKYVSGPMKGHNVFHPLATISFLVFILIYFPCVAVFVAVTKESGSVWWAVFMIVYTTFLAYIVSLLVYQVGSIIF